MVVLAPILSWATPPPSSNKDREARRPKVPVAIRTFVLVEYYPAGDVPARSALDSGQFTGPCLHPRAWGLPCPAERSEVDLPMRLPLIARTAVRLVAAALIGLAVTACGSGQAGWTYAPAPSATPVPSLAGSPATSGSPEASGSPQASGAPPATVTIVATSPLRFDTPNVEAPAGIGFVLAFDNQDSTQPHNVVIRNPDGSKVEMGDTSFFVGPETRTYQVPALEAGEYPFLCEVHPQAMTGTLTVT